MRARDEDDIISDSNLRPWNRNDELDKKLAAMKLTLENTQLLTSPQQLPGVLPSINVLSSVSRDVKVKTGYSPRGAKQLNRTNETGKKEPLVVTNTQSKTFVDSMLDQAITDFNSSFKGHSKNHTRKPVLSKYQQRIKEHAMFRQRHSKALRSVKYTGSVNEADLMNQEPENIVSFPIDVESEESKEKLLRAVKVMLQPDDPEQRYDEPFESELKYDEEQDGKSESTYLQSCNQYDEVQGHGPAGDRERVPHLVRPMSASVRPTTASPRNSPRALPSSPRPGTAPNRPRSSSSRSTQLPSPGKSVVDVAGESPLAQFYSGQGLQPPKEAQTGPAVAPRSKKNKAKVRIAAARDDEERDADGPWWELIPETTGKNRITDVDPAEEVAYVPPHERGFGVVKAGALLDDKSEERRTKPFAYPKARDLRSLNDQMRSTSQSMLLNVHPVWRDEKALRKAQDINRRMAEDCTRTNNTDHTWQILKTPGYMESQGPQEFYKSEQQAGHVMSEALMRSTRAADVSLGLQKNAISAWSENAILSGIKCFTSGGTLKI